MQMVFNDFILIASIIVNIYFVVMEITNNKTDFDGITIVGLKEAAERNLPDIDKVSLIAKELSWVNWANIPKWQRIGFIKLLIRKLKGIE